MRRIPGCTGAVLPPCSTGGVRAAFRAEDSGSRWARTANHLNPLITLQACTQLLSPPGPTSQQSRPKREHPPVAEGLAHQLAGWQVSQHSPWG